MRCGFLLISYASVSDNVSDLDYKNTITANFCVNSCIGITNYIQLLRPCLFVCFIRALHRFQQSFSHITTVSECGRELNVHFF